MSKIIQLIVPDSAVTISATGSITIDLSAVQLPSTTPVIVPITITPTAIPTSTPVPTAVSNPLDSSYFSAGDLVAACQIIRPTHRVTCDGTTIWSGNEPAIRYGSTVTGTVIFLDQSTPVITPTTTVVLPPPTPIPTQPPTVTSLPGVAVLNLTYPPTGQVRPTLNHNSSPVIAVKLTIPNPLPKPDFDRNHLGFIRVAEFPGALVTTRDLCISRTAGDFASTEFANSVGTADTGPGFNFCIDNPSGFTTVGAAFNLMPGDIVYANVRVVYSPEFENSNKNGLFDFATPDRY